MNSWDFYLSALLHLVFPAVAFAVAVVSAVMVVVSCKTKRSDISDTEIEGFLEWVEKEGEDEVSDLSSYKKPEPNIVPIPAVGATITRAVKEPLFDRVWIPPTSASPAPPVEERMSSEAYSAWVDCGVNQLMSLIVSLPYSFGRGSEFRVNALSLWIDAKDDEWSEIYKNRVIVYDSITGKASEIPARVIWSRDGKYVLDSPIVLPRDSSLRFEFVNGLGRFARITAAIHGTWYSVYQAPSPHVGTVGPTTVSWFTQGVGQVDPNDPMAQPKTRADTTTFGCTPLPTGYAFDWYKFQVVPDDGADPDDVRELRNKGGFEFNFAQSCYRTFLGPECMTDEGADVTVGGQPVKITPLEYFKVQLSTQGMILKKGLWVRVLLRGVKTRPICG